MINETSNQQPNPSSTETTSTIKAEEPNPNDLKYLEVLKELYGADALEKLVNQNPRKNFQPLLEHKEKNVPINHCRISGLQVWGDAYRAAYLENFKGKVFHSGKEYLTIEIDMRLLKQFNDTYGDKIADKALLQFTNELLAHLTAMLGVEKGAEFYLYKMHEGGDDYSLGISGSTELLNHIMRELPPLLSTAFKPFEHVCKKSLGGQVVTTHLGAECGMSLIQAGENPRKNLLMLADQYKYPTDKLQQISSPFSENWGVLHNITEVHKHIALAHLEESKLTQILAELQIADDIALTEVSQASTDYSTDTGNTYESILNDLRDKRIDTMSATEIQYLLTDLYDILYQPIALKIETGSDHILTQSSINEKFELAIKKMTESFGTRRLNPAGQYYLATIVGKCTEVKVKINHDIPLNPKQAAFLGLVSKEVAADVEEYIIHLIAQLHKSLSNSGLQQAVTVQPENVAKRTLAETKAHVDSLPVSQVTAIAEKFFKFLNN